MAVRRSTAGVGLARRVDSRVVAAAVAVSMAVVAAPEATRARPGVPVAGHPDTRTYGHTLLSQLSQDAISGISRTSFTYDTARNRTSVGAGSGTETATLAYDAASQPTSYSPPGGAAVPFQYDSNGNRPSGPAAEGSIAAYVYDQADRLRAVTADGATTSYQYDAGGLTATRTAGPDTQAFAWSADALPLLLTDGTNSYIYGPDGLPIEHVSATGEVVFYQHDQYGSTTSLTSTTGTELATFAYGPDGHTVGRTGAVDTPLRWNGEYRDSATGLYNLRARHYDPTTAQFLTRDPLEHGTGTPYSYADNDPVNLADPTGLCPMCVGAALGAGIDLAMQVLVNVSNGCEPFHDIAWGQVAVAAVLGAVGGAHLNSARVGITSMRAASAPARFAVNSAGEATMSLRAGSTALEVSEHAALRMTQRGVSIDAAESALAQKPFQYFHNGIWKTGYYDAGSGVFLGSVNGQITTVIARASTNYINNLKAAVP